MAEELLQEWLSGQNKLQRKVVRNEQNFLEGDPGARKIEASWPARLFGRAHSVYIGRHPQHTGRQDRISFAYEPVPQAPLSGADRAAARAGSFDDTLLTLLSAIRDGAIPRREFDAMWPIRPSTTSGRAGGNRRQKSRTSISATRTVFSTTDIDPELILASDNVGEDVACVLYRDGERITEFRVQGSISRIRATHKSRRGRVAKIPSARIVEPAVVFLRTRIFVGWRGLRTD